MKSKHSLVILTPHTVAVSPVTILETERAYQTRKAQSQTNIILIRNTVVHFTTKVKSGILHVRDHMFRVRDFSSTFNVQEHLKHFRSSYERYFS